MDLGNVKMTTESEERHVGERTEVRYVEFKLPPSFSFGIHIQPYLLIYKSCHVVSLRETLHYITVMITRFILHLPLFLSHLNLVLIVNVTNLLLSLRYWILEILHVYD